MAWAAVAFGVGGGEGLGDGMSGGPGALITSRCAQFDE